MTATAPEDHGVRSDAAPDGPADGDVGADPAEEYNPVVRRRPRTQRKKSKRVLWLQIGSTILFLGLLVGLGWAGYQASRKITGGGNAKVTDPNEPGYVAEVRPTPVDMVAVTGTSGALVSTLVVTEGAGGKGGSVSVLPASTYLPQFAESGPVFMPQAMAEGGLDGLRQRLGSALTFGFTSAEQVPAATVESLAQQAGPVKVDIVDNLIEKAPNGTETVKYRAGQVTLQPAEVVPFLEFTGADESVPNQTLRHQAVWEALLGALKGKDLSGVDAGPAPADGSAGSGFLGLLPGLLGGDISFDQVPLHVIPVPGTTFVAYAPDQAGMPAFVARFVPFPTAATPGQRARVQLLNGTTNKDAVVLTSPKVVAAGGEISLIGNAESFDVATTRVEYVVPEAKAAAEAIATALGVTATKGAKASGSVDVDVVVGRDRAT
jgi:hypothetical protein